MSANDYLLTIRLTTKNSLDPEAVGRIESEVAKLVRNTIWEASGVINIQANVWGRQGEGKLEAAAAKLDAVVPQVTTVPKDLQTVN